MHRSRMWRLCGCVSGTLCGKGDRKGGSFCVACHVGTLHAIIVFPVVDPIHPCGALRILWAVIVVLLEVFCVCTCVYVSVARRRVKLKLRGSECMCSRTSLSRHRFSATVLLYPASVLPVLCACLKLHMLNWLFVVVSHLHSAALFACRAEQSNPHLPHAAPSAHRH